MSGRSRGWWNWYTPPWIRSRGGPILFVNDESSSATSWKLIKTVLSHKHCQLITSLWNATWLFDASSLGASVMSSVKDFALLKPGGNTCPNPDHPHVLSTYQNTTGQWVIGNDVLKYILSQIMTFPITNSRRTCWCKIAKNAKTPNSFAFDKKHLSALSWSNQIIKRSILLKCSHSTFEWNLLRKPACWNQHTMAVYLQVILIIPYLESFNNISNEVFRLSSLNIP